MEYFETAAYAHARLRESIFTAYQEDGLFIDNKLW